MRSLRVFAIAAAILCSSAAAAELAATDGWHTWRIDGNDNDVVHFYVLIEEGKPVRIHNLSWDCQRPTKAEGMDHGVVLATESYDWFRAVIENPAVDEDIRGSALFGLVESGGDDAIAYIDRILSQR